MRFMDLLARRYASPFLMLEEMYSQGRFFEFVCEVNQLDQEEESEDKLWDVWLHKVFDKSFIEWKQSIEQTTEPEETDVKATVKNSFDILNGFNPQTGG